MPSPPWTTLSPGSKPIPIHVACPSTCYVYDIEDVRRLREEHHVCGVLMGTLPQVAQQNIFLGLPLMLLPEEIAVLVNHRIAILVDDKLAHITGLVQDEVNAYISKRKQDAREQQERSRQFEDEKRDKMQHVYRRQIEQRRKEKAEAKMNKRQQAQPHEDVSKESEEGSGLFGESDPPASRPGPSHTTGTQTSQGASSAADLSSVPYSIVVPGSSAGLPWYKERASTTHSTLASLYGDSSFAIGPILDVPSLEELLVPARYAVFKSLWKRGYFMGSGLKFGGDFLVYPGDPLRYHSHFTCTVLPSSNAPIDPLDIVSWGRLATAVKKAHLLAAPVDELYTAAAADAVGEKGDAPKEDGARYISLEWAGFG